MPNEAAAFYRRAFLEALPLLQGKNILCKVKVIISGIDREEFHAIDEGIFHVFHGVRQGSYAYNVVQETWENKFPNNNTFVLPNKADTLTMAIKQWVYTWMDG